MSERAYVNMSGGNGLEANMEVEMLSYNSLEDEFTGYASQLTDISCQGQSHSTSQAMHLSHASENLTSGKNNEKIGFPSRT